MRVHELRLPGFGLLGVLALGGCAVEHDDHLETLLACGEFTHARAHIEMQMTDDRDDRSFMLDRLSLGAVALAEGRADLAEAPLEEVYDVLRTQGINADKTVASVVINEDQKFWKGEPFEQAMAMHYMGLMAALRDDWGNVRAAAENSLFHLRDFGADDRGSRLSTEQIIERSSEDDDYFDHGYVARQSNFALGYLMSGIANRQLARAEEASDQFRAAVESNGALGDLAITLRDQPFNVLIVVEYGLGPRKFATGPDGAVARFMPRTQSDLRRLIVHDAGGQSKFPVVCDLNLMARDHMWNNLEDVRQAKSVIGTGMLIGGGVLLGEGLDDHNDTQTAAGLGLLLAGLYSKVTAHADTRYCPALPQRVYLAPLSLPVGDHEVEVEIEGLNHTLKIIPLRVEDESQLIVHALRLAN